MTGFLSSYRPRQIRAGGLGQRHREPGPPPGSMHPPLRTCGHFHADGSAASGGPAAWLSGVPAVPHGCGLWPDAVWARLLGPAASRRSEVSTGPEKRGRTQHPWPWESLEAQTASTGAGHEPPEALVKGLLTEAAPTGQAAPNGRFQKRPRGPTTSAPALWTVQVTAVWLSRGDTGR